MCNYSVSQARIDRVYEPERRIRVTLVDPGYPDRVREFLWEHIDAALEYAARELKSLSM